MEKLLTIFSHELHSRLSSRHTYISSWCHKKELFLIIAKDEPFGRSVKFLTSKFFDFLVKVNNLS